MEQFHTLELYTHHFLKIYCLSRNLITIIIFKTTEPSKQ